nr:hypothetical protein [bacterium]
DGIYDHNSGVDGLTAENYTVPGLFNAKLRVTDNLGAWDVDTIAVLVQSAELLVSYSPLEPDVADKITLSIDPPGTPALVEWDLDGDGTYEVDSGSSPSIEYAPAEPGEHPIAVRLTLASGGSQLLGAVRLLVRGWRQTLAVAGASAFQIDLAEVNGFPAIAYYTSGQGIYYVRALDAQGSAFGTPYLLDGTTAGDVRLLNVAGHPAVAYPDSTGVVVFVRSTDDDGVNWGAPVPVGSGVVSHFDLELVNGRPAVSYVNGGDLYYVRAASANGSSWGSTVLLDAVDFLAYGSMEVLNGNPAVLYYSMTDGDSYLIRANDADGGAWPAGRVSVVPNQLAIDLVVLNGLPATVYLSPGSPGVLSIKTANDVNGSNWFSSTIIAQIQSGNNLRVAVADGKPVVTWNANRCFALRGLDSSGGMWAPDEQFGFSSSTYLGREGLAYINDRIAVAYQRNNLGLTLAVRY